MSDVGMGSIGSPHLTSRTRSAVRVDLFTYGSFMEEEHCSVRSIFFPHLTHDISVNHSQDLTTIHKLLAPILYGTYVPNDIGF